MTFDLDFVLAVHGGAGVWRNELTHDREKACRAVIGEALLAGRALLEAGNTSIDAVEAAVRILEDSPLFNAGRGAVLTNKGTVELDAAIMDGRTRQAGAVCAVRRIPNPISAARLVMEHSPHVLLAGSGAEEFVKLHGVRLVSPLHFVTRERVEQLRRVLREERDRNDASAEPSTHDMIGTVGAVALDRHGNLAGATSTGGMVNKRFGRVGDSPLIGCGTYADNDTCAVSATGHGEYFIRAVAAHQLAMRLRLNPVGLAQCAEEVIADVAQLGGTGGLIALDRQGSVAMPFNTEGMFRGVIHASGTAQIAVFPK